MTEKTPVLMPYRYIMDPTVDDLLFDGEYLKNGMEVLIEYDNMRTPLPNSPAEILAEHMHRYKYNRWVIVSDVQVRMTAAVVSNAVVEFIGTFDDGAKAKFSVDATYAWYVKKASIAPKEKHDVLDELSAKLGLVMEADAIAIEAYKDGEMVSAFTSRVMDSMRAAEDRRRKAMTKNAVFAQVKFAMAKQAAFGASSPEELEKIAENITVDILEITERGWFIGEKANTIPKEAVKDHPGPDFGADNPVYVPEGMIQVKQLGTENTAIIDPREVRDGAGS